MALPGGNLEPMTGTAEADDDTGDRTHLRPRAGSTLEREALAALAEAMAGHPRAEAFLSRVCRIVVRRGGLAGAVIACPDPDGAALTLGGAFPEGLAEVVEQQFALQDGPSFDCWSSLTVVEECLAHAGTRWPRWARQGLARLPAGAEALRSDPIETDGGTATVTVLGSAAAVRSVDAATLRRVAQIAATHALVARSHGHFKTLAGQLQHALSSRVRIEQAKGALARHHGIGVDAAFERLRTLARDQDRRLHEVAAEIVDALARPTLPPDEPTVDGRTPTRPSLRVVRVPDGLRLIGAADVSSVPVLTAALGQLDGQDPVRVDLGRLEFLDAQCARILLQCATGEPAGRELLLTGARPVVAQVLALLGAGEETGVRLLTRTGR